MLQQQVSIDVSLTHGSHCSLSDEVRRVPQSVSASAKELMPSPLHRPLVIDCTSIRYKSDPAS